MDITLESVEAQVMQLSSFERAQLLSRLMASFDQDHELESAWEAECLRREQEIEAGAVQMLDGEQVLAELKAKYSA